MVGAEIRECNKRLATLTLAEHPPPAPLYLLARHAMRLAEFLLVDPPSSRQWIAPVLALLLAL